MIFSEGLDSLVVFHISPSLFFVYNVDFITLLIGNY
nr:MAG TPA: hypothetical protein [Inoviridae sp.]